MKSNSTARRKQILIGIAATIVFACVCGIVLLLLAGGAAFLTPPPPTGTVNLIGTWEAQIPGNQYQMQVSWNSIQRRYEGVLVKQGNGSQAVGFSIGELVWKAIPTNAPNVMKEQQEFREAVSGIPTGRPFWTDGEVYVDRSSPDTLVTSTATFRRVK